jgi:1-deoxy-D-xylulose-5-phosphate reductoisomerase
MRLPIQCALTYPKRLQPTVAPLDLAALGALHFSTPDLDRYPGLRLCQEAGRRGGTYPCVMAAADELAVAAFMQDHIPFTAIPEVIEAALTAHRGADNPDLETIDAADAWARSFTQRHITERMLV